MAEIGLESVVAAAARQVSAETDGETAILELEGGVYYGLDRTGTAVWRRIREPVTVEAVCRDLDVEYAADPATLRADVLRLLGELVEAGLVEVRG